MDKSVILITGALTGIGRATAVAFAKKGANVVVACPVRIHNSRVYWGLK